MEGVSADLVKLLKLLGGLKHSSHLHETHLNGMAIFLSGPLCTTNKMADQRNVLAGALILLLLVPPAAAFQCLGELFCTLFVISLCRLYLG